MRGMTGHTYLLGCWDWTSHTDHLMGFCKTLWASFSSGGAFMTSWASQLHLPPCRGISDKAWYRPNTSWHYEKCKKLFIFHQVTRICCLSHLQKMSVSWYRLGFFNKPPGSLPVGLPALPSWTYPCPPPEHRGRYPTCSHVPAGCSAGWVQLRTALPSPGKSFFEGDTAHSPLFVLLYKPSHWKKPGVPKKKKKRT